MSDIVLHPIAPEVFECQCLADSETEAILRQARASGAWEPGPVYKTSTASAHVREEVRLAWEIREENAPAEFSGFRDMVRERIAGISARLTDEPLTVSAMRLVRYDTGGFFKVHIDGPLDDGKRFAVVIYLNDDFDGGETVFPLLGCRATPKRGQALVFPAKRLHRGDTVTNGSKYILVTWLVDREAGS